MKFAGLIFSGLTLNKDFFKPKYVDVKIRFAFVWMKYIKVLF